MAMMPRLQAEESLRRVNEQHATMPEVAQRDRNRIIAVWERTARPNEERRPTPDELAIELALVGIGIKRVPA